MKKIVLFTLLFSLFLLPKFVFADSWIDEGNYNPDWHDKCPYGMCYFDTEEDFAGALKSYSQGSGSFGSETMVTKGVFDFTAHDWVSTNGRFCPLVPQTTFKAKAGQGFCIANHPTTTVQYLCSVESRPTSHGQVIPEKTEGWTGESVTIKVYPDDGYYLEDIYYSDHPNQISYHGTVVKVDDETYRVSLIASNVYIHSVFYPYMNYTIYQNLGEGVTSSFQEDKAREGSHLDIVFTVEEGYEITSVVFNGEVVELVNNRLEFDVTKNSTITVNTRRLDSVTEPEIQITNYVNDGASVSTSVGTVLEYRVVVENKGLASVHNHVVTNLPKEINYVLNSATHDGVYDKENHQITWDIDVIEKDQTYEFSYKGVVTENAIYGEKYIGNSYIDSDSINDRIVSDNTVVSLMRNPYTFHNKFFIILVIIFLLDATIITIYKSHSTNS